MLHVYQKSNIPSWLPAFLFSFVFFVLAFAAQAQFADDAPIDPNSENPRLHGLGDLIQTNYPVPAGAYFVAVSGGNDTTGTGTQAAPWRSLAKAINTVPAGATIILRGGTYRPSAIINVNRKVILQPYPQEQVWIKGSLQVAGWAQEPGKDVWRKDNWQYAFSKLSKGTPYSGACTRCIDARYPEADYRDMAFLDDKSLKQVLSLAAVAPGTFYLDSLNRKLYIGNNPVGKTVEVTAQERGLSIFADDVVIRGLGFAHYADRAVHINNGADFGVFEKNTVVWNALEGIGCTGTNVIFRGNNFSYNGHIGLETGRSNKTLLENNVFRFNNLEFFRTGWAAAGTKLTDASQMVIKNNLFEKNFAHTLWLDNGIRDAVIVGNTFRGNSGQAILFEISNGAIIAGNVCIRNSVGISVSGSQNAQVYNNTLVDNGTALVVNEYIRNDIAHLYNFRVEQAVFKNNIVSNATLATGALFSVARSDCAKKDPMVTGLDYNAYYRTNASQSLNAVRWNPVPDNCDGQYFPTIAAFRAALGFEQNALVIENEAVNPFFIDEENGDYRLKPGSPAINRGTPLPTAVAQALGWEENIPVNMGAKLTYDGTSGDVTAPAAPANLQSPDKTETTVLLAWEAASDNTGVTRYLLFKGTELAGSVTAAVTSYTVTGLLPDKPYTFTVKAQDASGNISPAGNALAITTDKDNQAPSTPGNPTLVASSATSVSISWHAAHDNIGIAAYDLYNGATLLGSIAGDTTGSIYHLSPGLAYNVTVKARDASGNVSEASGVLPVTTAAGYLAPVKEDTYVRDGESTRNFGTDASLLTKFSTDKTRREAYLKFDVSGVTKAIASAKLILYGSLTTTQNNNIPVALYPVADNTWSEKLMNWNNKPVSGNTALTTVTATNASTSHYIWDLTSYINQQIKAGNSVISLAVKNTAISSNLASWAAKEKIINIPYLEITYAEPPAASQLTATVRSQRTIALNWTNQADNTDGYHLERAGAGSDFMPLATLPATATAYTDTDLPASTTYRYRIIAFNAGGSTPSAEISGTTWAAGTGLTGTYYKSKHFNGSSFARPDSTINFDWGFGAPVAGMSHNTFSIRWQGQIETKYNEQYTFTTRTDDGVRLWVNGQLLIDDWTQNGEKTNSASLLLEADKRYDIQLEYFENDGNAVAKLFWSSTSQPEEIIPGRQLYPAATMAPANAASESAIVLYPNPANRQVTVKFMALVAANVQITIFDTYNQPVLHYNNKGHKGENNVNLNISALREGVYIVRVHYSDGTKSLKLLVNK